MPRGIVGSHVRDVGLQEGPGMAGNRVQDGVEVQGG
jgi:hypothetical protein